MKILNDLVVTGLLLISMLSLVNFSSRIKVPYIVNASIKRLVPVVVVADPYTKSGAKKIENDNGDAAANYISYDLVQRIPGRSRKYKYRLYTRDSSSC